MKTGIRAGVSYKTQYKAYKDRGAWRKNKIKKLERRVLANPEDKGAELALEKFLKTTTQVYGRGKPGQKGWFHPQEQNFLKMTGSSDPKIVEYAGAKLAKIRDVYADTRPSAVRMKEYVYPELNKLCEVGLINEKRKETANTRMDRIRRR